MGGPSQRDPSKDYAAGIKVYLANYQKLIDAENASRAANDPSRVQETLDLEKKFDPNRTAIRDSQSASILADLQSGRSLSPDMRREAEQNIRGAQAARGNVYGAAPISAEALYKGSVAENLYQRKLANAGTLLSTPSISTPDRSAQYTVGGLNAGQMGVNFGQQSFANQQAAGNPWASALGGAASGAAAGSAAGPYGALAGAVIGGVGGYVASDERFKTDIIDTGETHEGIPIKEFRYWGESTRHRGLMAQDVKKLRPDAVAEDLSGFMFVNYDALGFKLQEVS